MTLKFSDEAKKDLKQIADYIAKDNPRRALSFSRDLRSKCASLVCYPLAYPLVLRYKGYGIRRCLHGDYLIFYRVENEHVVIVHVLHGASDFTPTFSEE